MSAALRRRSKSAAGPLRAAVYVRLSKETEASTSPERQLEACRSTISAKGWEEVDVFQDLDVSAFSGRRRPGLEAAREAIRSGAVDALVFYRVDRLARSTLEFHSLLREAEERGVFLVSATEALDFSTPMGRAMAGIVSIFAQLEAETISLRVRDTQRHLAEVGRWRGGRRPYGWRPVPMEDGPGHRLVLDPEESAVLLEVVGRVLQREPLTRIAQDLIVRRIPPAESGPAHKRDEVPWTTQTLQRILRRPGLLGHAIHDGRTVVGEDGRPVLVAEPLLDLATFKALQEELDRRHTPRDRRRKESALLSGVGFCGSCGQKLYASSSGERTSYRCASYTAPNRLALCSAPASIDRRKLDDHVQAAFLSAVGSFPVVRQVEVLDEAAEAREALLHQRETLMADRLAGLYSTPEGEAFFRRTMAAVEEKLSTLPASFDARTEYQETGETFAQAWAARDDLGRAALLASALDAVEVFPASRPGLRIIEEGRVVLRWREEVEAA